MKKNSYKIRLLLTYSTFTIALITVLFMGFYIYNYHALKLNEIAHLEQMVEKRVIQFDQMIKRLDEVSIQLISEREVMNGLNAFTYQHHVPSEKSIQKTILYHLKKIEYIKLATEQKISRVTIFNKEGKIFSSKQNDMNPLELKQELMNQQWIQDVRNKNGTKFIRAPFFDQWLKEDKEYVISFNRLYRNPKDEIGFIEVQQSYNDLHDMFDEEQVKIMIFNENNDLLYHSETISYDKKEEYIKYITSGVWDGGEELITYRKSQYSGCIIMMSRDMDQVLEPILVVRNVTIVIGFIMILVSVAFIYIFTNLLTRPILKLTCKINGIDLDNLTEEICEDSKYEEMNLLTRSFGNMRDRLNEAINQTYHLKALQLKAHFDMLQEQVNPHFLYNTIGVIANMGDEAGVSGISNACRELIHLLRYSVSDTNEQSTIEKEIEYARYYLSLMKIRYEHRLNYIIQLDEEIKEIPIPKMIIQPLIENAIMHGYKTSMVECMKIKILAECQGDKWSIEVVDEGTGFDQETLAHIRKRIQRYKSQVLDKNELNNLSISDGIGIINTFARLQLFYKEHLNFEIISTPTGTRVRIEFLNQFEERDVEDGL